MNVLAGLHDVINIFAVSFVFVSLVFAKVVPSDPRRTGILVHSALPVEPCTSLDDAPITDTLRRVNNSYLFVCFLGKLDSKMRTSKIGEVSSYTTKDIWSKCIPDHLSEWFERSDHNVS